MAHNCLPVTIGGFENLSYIHRNPVKRALAEMPDAWRWSSFRHYACGEDRDVEIESERTAAARR